MTFKKEISIDGVSAIAAAIAIVALIVTMKVTQLAQGKTLDEHTQQLRETQRIQANLAQSLAVLSQQMVDWQNGHVSSINRADSYPTPRQSN